MYKLQRWFPHPQMGGAGFNIILNKEWKDAVSQSAITQEGIDNMIDNLGNFILQGHGRDAMEEHMVKCRIRVKWGEWGPEHITVPGNACGLDIDRSCVGCGSEEVALTPHNVDSINQASMLLTIFVKIAEILEGEVWQRERNITKPSEKGVDYEWRKYSEQKPPMGQEVLAYHPDWVDEDFNPKGIRTGFQDLSDGDDGDFVSAHYWSHQDCYMTISHGICDDNLGFSDEIKNSIEPELWASLDSLTDYLPQN